MHIYGVVWVLNGHKQVQMGVNECAWVQWDTGDTGGHKNKVSIDKNSYLWHDLWPMAEEISPDMMFCDFKQKVVWMCDGGYSGYKCVHMGAVGYRGTGGQENKGERGTNGRSWQYFVIHDHCKKIMKSAGMIAATRDTLKTHVHSSDKLISKISSHTHCFLTPNVLVHFCKKSVTSLVTWSQIFHCFFFKSSLIWKKS